MQAGLLLCNTREHVVCAVGISVIRCSSTVSFMLNDVDLHLSQCWSFILHVYGFMTLCTCKPSTRVPPISGILSNHCMLVLLSFSLHRLEIHTGVLTNFLTEVMSGCEAQSVTKLVPHTLYTILLLEVKMEVKIRVRYIVYIILYRHFS